ncbi:MAG: CHAT domain-containing protein, partial [bacterium]
LSTIVENLKHQELGLLTYHISEETSFVMVTTGDGVQIVRLQVSPNSLTTSIDSLIYPLHNVNQDSVRFIPFRATSAYRLYQLLIQPAEKAITLPKRLLIVPDLLMMNLPFELLIFKKPDKSEYTPSDFPTYADKFLLHRYSFAYAPSSSFLEVKSNPVSNKTKVLTFANPIGKISMPASYQDRLRSLTGWRFTPLPYSDYEAKSIKNILSNIKTYRRANATKANFFREAPKHQIIHLATHGFVDLTFDAFSGLVFATDKDSTDDGLLMGYEISDLGLQCDLITLSACETGRGRVVAGEGVLGLPRLFLGSGVKTVLMTLWKVDDKFTSELMPKFYDNLFNQKLTKADALCEAKRTLISKKSQISNGVYYQHPFYWASFVLYGDPGLNQGFSMLRIEFLAAIFSILILTLVILFYIQLTRRHKRL